MCEPDHKLYYLIPEERTGPKLCHKKWYEPPLVKTKCLQNSPINSDLFNFQDCDGC